MELEKKRTSYGKGPGKIMAEADVSGIGRETDTLPQIIAQKRDSASHKGFWEGSGEFSE
jgi:hypothetical protein